MALWVRILVGAIGLLASVAFFSLPSLHVTAYDSLLIYGLAFYFALIPLACLGGKTGKLPLRLLAGGFSVMSLSSVVYETTRPDKHSFSALLAMIRLVFIGLPAGVYAIWGGIETQVAQTQTVDDVWDDTWDDGMLTQVESQDFSEEFNEARNHGDIVCWIRPKDTDDLSDAVRGLHPLLNSEELVSISYEDAEELATDWLRFDRCYGVELI